MELWREYMMTGRQEFATELIQSGHGHLVGEMALQRQIMKLKDNEDFHEFQEQKSVDDDEESSELYDTVLQATDRLHNLWKESVTALESLQGLQIQTSDLVDALHRRLAAIIMSRTPDSFIVKLEKTFSWLLSELVAAKGWNTAEEGQGFCHQAETMSKESEEEILQRVEQLACSLNAVGLGSISSSCVWKSACTFIDRIVNTEPDYDFSTAKLSNMKTCMNDVLIGFFASSSEYNEGTKQKLAGQLWHVMGTRRTADLFDMAKDLDESSGGLEDLRQSLREPQQHHALLAKLITDLESRLLQPGTSTAVILQMYVRLIRALQVLDPSGVLIKVVSLPITNYLCSRKDTIRCVVTMLTEDHDPESSGGAFQGADYLLEELSNAKTNNLDDDVVEESSAPGGISLEQLENGELWEPDPVEADTATRKRSKTASIDIVNILVNIYGTKELFVNEYRNLLADKLLAKTDYDTDRDVRTIELLKLRFGEDSLQNCEIMLSDIAESKRINLNVLARMGRKGPLEANITSDLFWPVLVKGDCDDIQPPKDIRDLMEEYSNAYSDIRAPRKLKWKPHIGTVTLKLTFKNDSREFTVSSILASIISRFSDCDEWEAKALADELAIPQETLIRKMSFWISQGVIVEESTPGGTTYRSVEEIGEHVSKVQGDEGVSESMVISAEEQAAADMNVYEQYIIGMLTNLNNLPADRIHNMLKMFANDPPYDKTINELTDFLRRLVIEDKLEVNGDGTYSRSIGRK